jgi:hypothetical protein
MAYFLTPSKKSAIQAFYSHCQIRVNASNHSGSIAETIPAQVLSSSDLFFHAPID